MEFTRPDPNASCDPRHLANLMGLQPGDVDIHKDKVIVHVDPPANAQEVIDSYVYDPDWEPDGPKKDWRTTLNRELDWLRTEVASAPAAGTTTSGNAVARVDALIQHIKRLDRDLIRVVEFIASGTLDSGNG